MSETVPSTHATVEPFGPADWRARRKPGWVELSRPDRVLIVRLTVYAVIFLSALASVFDDLFALIGVVSALAVPIFMTARMRALGTRSVLRSAHQVRTVATERREAHYRETAVSHGHLTIDGERFDPADVELLRVHRIHRTGEHVHRTHHVWLRTPDRLFELGAFAITSEAEALARFFQGQLPELRVGDESSKADTLRLPPAMVALTVGMVLSSWALTLGAPFLGTPTEGPGLGVMVFAVGVAALAVEELHERLMGRAGDPMARGLRRRFRLGR